MLGSVVDTPSAQEFMREIVDRISTEELGAIAGDLERKSLALRTLLRTPEELDRDRLRAALRWVFSTRRRADRIIESVTPERLAAAINDLLYAQDGLPERIERFDTVLAEFPDIGFDLPGELLHFTSPDRYWLWTRWTWDPRTETGALRLVTADDVDLAAGSPRGETYLAVGQAMAGLDDVGRSAGLTTDGQSRFGTDVFLAAVYGVYMYTILRMRMTEQFNQVVPPMPDLVRRLLGVYHLEV